MTSLAKLRGLKEALASIEGRRAGAEQPALTDREAVISALTFTVDYLDAVGAEAKPLRLLLAAFHVSGSPLLKQQKQGGGQVGAPLEDNLRGKIAGVVFLKAAIDDGKTREAADWVAGALPKKLHKALSSSRKGKVSKATIYSWYARWNGPHSESGPGRDGYRFIVAAGLQQNGRLPAERALRKVLAALAETPGISESI